MKKDGKGFSVTVWSAVALGAVGIGVVIAFFAGYFLGHFTGHEGTTTVAAVPAESGGAKHRVGGGEEGKEEQSAPEEEAGGGEEASGKEAGGEKAGGGEAAAAGGAGNPEEGATVFAANCSICHGSDGHGGSGGPDLRTMPKAKTEAGAIEQVTNGGGGMPPFGGTLSEEEIKNVASYVVQDVVGGG